MKAIKLADNKMKLVISRSEWEKMGREAGWGDIFKPIINPIKKALEPEYTNPYVQRDEDSSGSSYQIGATLEERQVMETTVDKININDVIKKIQAYPSSDPEVLLAFNRATKYLTNPPKTMNSKILSGLKILLFRIVNLNKSDKKQTVFLEMLKKWNKEKQEEDRMWNKPKNPYL